METSLHRQLKQQYGPEAGGRLEVVLKGYRIDAVERGGTLIEVQSGPLGPLRGKLGRLLAEHRVRVVKPVVLARRLVRRARRNGSDLSARLSPRKGAAFDVFDDLIGLARVFPHPNLHLEILTVEIDEVRVPRRRWPGFAVVDRSLRRVVAAIELHEPGDLWSLLPGAWDGPFTTVDLAERLGRPVDFAQRVAYCLRLAGAVDMVGKSGNRRIYRALGRGGRPGSREVADGRPRLVSP